ncbi:MAG: type II secretion system protein GspN [Thermodesulfobacteriota bacterium]|nr:type II secretion system protein GspN [Thermodesulfobacteriota bacterium]
MKQRLSKYKRPLGYVLYGIFLTIAILYFRFPSDALREYVQTTAQRAGPRFLLSIRDLRPYLPFGVEFLEAEFASKKTPDTNLFKAESLLVRPMIWSFLQGRPGYYFDCLAYDGALRGSFIFAKETMKAPFTASVKLKDISIDHYDFLTALIGRSIKGTMEGSVMYTGQSNLFAEGTGEANVRIADGKFDLVLPVLTLGSIDFSELLIRLALEKQELALSRVELKGRDIKGTLSGSIGLKKEFFESDLDIMGMIEPLASFAGGLKGALGSNPFIERLLKKGGLRFSIQGTLTDPEFKLL